MYHSDTVLGQPVEQLCLPQSRVTEVCRLAHDVSHQGIKRTKEKIRLNFFWDHMSKTITDYINQCHECQFKARAVVKDQIPISVIPRDPLPFAHLYMDIIGPLFDRAEFRYCLCLIDSHTTIPFAFPLRSVTPKAVCDCLLQVFAMVGVSYNIRSRNMFYCRINTEIP